MIGEDGSQTHCAGVKDGFATEATETRMAMDNLDLLPNDNVAEYGEKGEHGREGSFAVDNEERNVIDLESVGEVSDSRSALVCMSDDNDFMSAIDQFLGNCQNMTRRSSYCLHCLQKTADICDSQFPLDWLAGNTTNHIFFFRTYLTGGRRSH